MIETKLIGTVQVGSSKVTLHRVTLHEARLAYDLGEVDLKQWNVYPNKRNVVWTNFDAEARKRYKEMLASETA